MNRAMNHSPVALLVAIAFATVTIGGCGRPKRLAARVPDAAVAGGAVRLVVLPSHGPAGPRAGSLVGDPVEMALYQACRVSQ
jgi:hypothetical protein